MPEPTLVREWNRVLRLALALARILADLDARGAVNADVLKALNWRRGPGSAEDTLKQRLQNDYEDIRNVPQASLKLQQKLEPEPREKPAQGCAEQTKTEPSKPAQGCAEQTKTEPPKPAQSKPEPDKPAPDPKHDGEANKQPIRKPAQEDQAKQQHPRKQTQEAQAKQQPVHKPKQEVQVKPAIKRSTDSEDLFQRDWIHPRAKNGNTPKRQNGKTSKKNLTST